MTNPAQPRLLLDISVLVQTDRRTGIERVTRALLGQFHAEPPPGHDVQAIYHDGVAYRCADHWCATHLGWPPPTGPDPVVCPARGDRLLALELNPGLVPRTRRLLEHWRARGVELHFIVFDLLPVQRPDWFLPQVHTHFLPWLHTLIAVADGLWAISNSVAEDLRAYVQTQAPERQSAPRIGHFHLGADLAASLPTNGLPPEAESILATLRARATLLSVATIEPRKGHAQTLAACERLWAGGHDFNLVFVGKQGWLVDTLAERLRRHPESGRRFFWLPGISDTYLEAVYAASRGLLAVSEGEGFGLPLIEAARHQLPILARDLPVFREVAGQQATWFAGTAPEDLAHAIAAWLPKLAEGTAIPSTQRPWMTWEASARQLWRALGHGAATSPRP
ncbi:hypothetical protein CKO27_21005 [Thiocystis violacea]|nr:hypothetical protein [Thiocystis violacea]